MSGFPNRPGRTAYGPTFVNQRPVTHPEQEIGDSQLNLLCWQAAGMGLVVPKVVITATVSGSAVTNVAQMLAWDPNGAVSKIAFSYAEAGRYTFAFAESYEDENGTERDIDLIGGEVTPMNQSTAGVGVVELDDGYSGTVRLFNMSGTLTDPTAFILKLW